MKTLCALYKAFRGGEWFDCSLSSIEGHVDQVFVVMSNRAWNGGGAKNNCMTAIQDWNKKRPGWITVIWHDTEHQEEQYRVGLEAIVGRHGDAAAVLVIDTDEVWETESLERLRHAINANPGVSHFTAHILTYIRSPLYQVYPQEAGRPVVALQSANLPPGPGRLSPEGRPTKNCDDVWFHHFPYVRVDEGEIPSKFGATSSQERISSNPDWLSKVWPNLPRGKLIHMTRGCEACWGEIKVLPAPPLDLPVFCQRIIEQEESRWQAILETDHPDATLVPVPTEHDEVKYSEFHEDPLLGEWLSSRLKMTYLEAMVLYRLAGQVGSGGRILEIGSGSGGSLACMAIASGAELWAVDPFTPYDEKTHGGTARGVVEGNEEQFWETARLCGYADRIIHVKQNSDVAAEQCPDELFDLVLIDGNHTDAIALADLGAYWPKVKPGGTLLAHDYTTRFPGVIWAMKQWGVPYSVYAGTSLAYARKPR